MVVRLGQFGTELEVFLAVAIVGFREVVDALAQGFARCGVELFAESFTQNFFETCDFATECAVILPGELEIRSETRLGCCAT